MRTRFLSCAVALTLVLGAQTLMGKKAAMPLKLSVRKQVDSEIDNLRKNLKIAKTWDSKWKFFEKTTSNIKDLRSKAPRQFEGDEVYMSFVEGGLEEIPLRDKFVASQCPQYRIAIVNGYNPRQEFEPNEAVTQALSVLDLLCESKK